ncbi:MAG: secreted protein containing domain of murein hydrolase [Lachnospiraceae bacterium]|nr:secreted protein containing domain of murein hydrolase [Lachnospiraceae bacterium]
MKRSHTQNKSLIRKRKRRKLVLQRIRLTFQLIATCILFGIALFLAKDLIRHYDTPSGSTSSSSLFAYDYTADYHTDSLSAAPDAVSQDMVIVEARGSLTSAELEEKLAKLALENKEIAEIYADKELYPEELLTALANNQELIPFVKGYLSSDGTVKGGISPEEEAQSFPLFLQWDQRWGYAPYGGSCIGTAGCGPTCLSMVIFALTRDLSATPDALAAYSMSSGFYTKGAGTDWSFMTYAASQYGLHAKELGLDEDAMKQYLNQGHPIICAMRAGDFTTGGHFIVLYGYDENGFLVNDPNSVERSSRHWDFDTLHYQIKNLWGYSLS